MVELCVQNYVNYKLNSGQDNTFGFYFVVILVIIIIARGM